MLSNAGGKLRVIAVVLFILNVVCAAIYLVVGFDELGVGAFIATALLILSGWVSAVAMCALADAAENAKTAAYYAEQIAMYVNKKESNAEDAAKDAVQKAAEYAVGQPGGKMPTWQRLELERAEAEQKAAQTEQE